MDAEIRFEYATDIRGLDRAEVTKELKMSLPEVTLYSSAAKVEGNPYGLSSREGATQRLVLSLPRSSSLQVGLYAGDVTVADLEGDVDLATQGGDFKVFRITGDVSLATSGGDITLGSITGGVSGATSGGEIDVREVRGKCELATSGGDIQLESIEGQVSATTHGGDIWLKEMKGPRLQLSTALGDVMVIHAEVAKLGEIATANGQLSLEQCTGDFRLANSAGDIDLMHHRGDVTLRTDAGEIHAEDIQGGLQASTSVGDIVVSLAPVTAEGAGGVELKTANGDVDLTLPVSIGAYLEVTVGSDGGKRDVITSEYDLKTSVEKDVRVTAHSEVNGGGIPVVLVTKRGRITIRK